MKTERKKQADSRSEFERIASDDAAPGLIAEFWDFVRHNKKWWLLPIFFAVLIAGVLLFLAATPIAPFIYPFF